TCGEGCGRQSSPSAGRVLERSCQRTALDEARVRACRYCRRTGVRRAYRSTLRARTTGRRLAATGRCRLGRNARADAVRGGLRSRVPTRLPEEAHRRGACVLRRRVAGRWIGAQLKPRVVRMTSHGVPPCRVRRLKGEPV